MKNVILISTILFATIFSSCKVQKNNVDDSSKASYPSIENLQKSFSKSNYSILYNAELESYKGKKVSGNIIVSNDFVYINGVVKNLGIEVFKLKVWNDSIMYLDRINKQFYTGLVQDLKMIRKFDYIVNNLNSILLGRVFQDSTSGSSFDNKVGSYSIALDLNKTFSLDYSNIGLIKKLEYCDSSECTSIIYDSYSKNNDPNVISIYNNDNVSAIIKFQSVKKYRGEMINFKIPKSYSQL